jgi:RNA methyltransferase, TrmH family
MITSPDNDTLKLIRRLARRRHRRRTGLFVAEGEDLLDAASAAGVEPEVLLVAGADVEPRLLDGVSALGSGTRVVGVYRQRFAEAAGELSVYLDGVADPANVGATIRSAHALCDGAVVLGPGCADPYGPKAVRASMGSIFARPPARSEFEALEGTTIALERGAPRAIDELADDELAPPIVVCLGAERDGLRAQVRERAARRAEIPLRPDGPDSLNVAMAATIALHVIGRRIAPAAPTRMADHA